MNFSSEWIKTNRLTIKMKRIPILKYLPVTLLMVFIICFFSSCNSKAQSPPSKSVDKKPPLEVQEQSEWPCFHGSDYRNKSTETGLLSSWPDEGSELLYTISGLGEGYASISIADGLLYTSGSIDEQTFVFAYDLDGNLVWKKSNGTAWDVEVYWAKGYDGSRSTPTYDDGVVYHLSEASRLSAYNAKTGEEIWSRNLMKDFAAEMPDYGFTESVRIDGDKLFVRPAGRKGFQVCLNKTNGKTIWMNNEIPGTYAYNSGVISDFGGYRQLIGASSLCYYGVDTETGKMIWKVDFENQYEVNCTDAVVVDDYVFLSSGEGGGSVLVKLVVSNGKIQAEKVWETDLMDSYHGGVIFHKGYLYGSGDRSRGWFSLNMKTGEKCGNRLREWDL